MIVDLTDEELNTIQVALVRRMMDLGGRRSDPRVLEGVHPITDSLHAKAAALYEKLVTPQGDPS